VAINEILLSDWKRSFCQSVEYPAFGDPEPVVLPDMMTEQWLNFLGFVCYETMFVLESPKELLLEISNAAGAVELFINGETAEIQIVPPYLYDLSDFARQGKNYLAIEVAVTLKRNHLAVAKNLSEKMRYDKDITSQPCIIGNVRLYTN
jgi:hypothetical protein